MRLIASAIGKPREERSLEDALSISNNAKAKVSLLVRVVELREAFWIIAAAEAVRGRGGIV